MQVSVCLLKWGRHQFVLCSRSSVQTQSHWSKTRPGLHWLPLKPGLRKCACALQMVARGLPVAVGQPLAIAAWGPVPGPRSSYLSRVPHFTSGVLSLGACQQLARSPGESRTSFFSLLSLMLPGLVKAKARACLSCGCPAVRLSGCPAVRLSSGFSLLEAALSRTYSSRRCLACAAQSSLAPRVPVGPGHSSRGPHRDQEMKVTSPTRPHSSPTVRSYWFSSKIHFTSTHVPPRAAPSPGQRQLFPDSCQPSPPPATRGAFSALSWIL